MDIGKNCLGGKRKQTKQTLKGSWEIRFRNGATETIKAPTSRHAYAIANKKFLKKHGQITNMTYKR